MKFFKKEQDNLIEILNEQLWLSKYIVINNKHIYYKHYEKMGICQIKDLLDNNCEFLDHIAPNQRYKLKSSFMNMIQFKSSTPSKWKNKLKQCNTLPQNIPPDNIIKINNKIITIEKSTCKLFYWHIINTCIHKPTATQKWSDHFWSHWFN